jgi:hypothetical protein
MDFKTLIMTAPFSEDRKTDMIARIPDMTEDEKMAITEEAWALIIAQQQISIDEKIDAKMERVATSSDETITEKDIEGIQDRAFLELERAHETARAQQEIAHITQSIQQPS